MTLLPTIDWDQQPAWANHAAMDGDGQWYRYSDKPTRATVLKVWKRQAGRMEVVVPNWPEIHNWRKSLQSRPGA